MRCGRRSQENPPKTARLIADLPRRAEVVLDHLAERPGECRRDRGDEDEPGDLLVGRLDRSAAHRAEPGRDESADVGPEVDDDRDERPEVESDVEGLVEILVFLEVVPVRSHGTRIRWPDDEIGRSRSALHDSEDECR